MDKTADLSGDGLLLFHKPLVYVETFRNKPDTIIRFLLYNMER